MFQKLALSTVKRFIPLNVTKGKFSQNMFWQTVAHRKNQSSLALTVLLMYVFS